MPKISIIMPLYNASKYLGETLQSVQGQTFTDYELICINDASADDTAEILCSFQRKDARIQILTNAERHGAAYSRNRGMAEAKGEYLAFLDGDDIFEEEMFEKAYQTALESQADIVIYEYRHVPSDSIYNKQRVLHSKQYLARYCRRPFSIRDYAPYECIHFGLGPCNKLYRKAFIEQCGISFQELPCSNDVYFVCMAIMLSERLLLLQDERVMVYARDHNEPTRISADKNPMCCYQAFMHITEELQAKNQFSDLYPYFCHFFVSLMRSSLRQCRTEEKEKTFYQFLQREGVMVVRALGGSCYEGLDDYIKSNFEKFLKKDFASKWYREETGLRMQLGWEKNAKKITDLFVRCKERGQAVGIWGAGANGFALLHFCKVNHLDVEMIIDKSKEKQGHMIDGFAVNAPEDICGRLQVVIIATRHIMESVREELAGQSVEIIDINPLLYVY